MGKWIEFSDKVKPILLTSDTSNLKDNSKFLITGWGHYKVIDEISKLGGGKENACCNRTNLWLSLDKYFLFYADDPISDVLRAGFESIWWDLLYTCQLNGYLKQAFLHHTSSDEKLEHTIQLEGSLKKAKSGELKLQQAMTRIDKKLNR